MARGTLSRRGFLQGTTAGLAAAGLPLWFARETAASMPIRPARPSRDKVVMGAIGTGGRGSSVIEEAVRQGGEYVAICDVDRRRRDGARKLLGKLGQDKVDEFGDFRELLDRKDITAVSIATPDHWHALIAIEALKRGKDVYCEKPLSLTIAEGRAMVEAARKYDRVFQTGSQQRSDARFRLACELVRNGRLGKIKTVETYIGANPTGGPFPVEETPKGLDWDFWMGPTPTVDYVDRRFNEFRWWYEYSGGKVTDWGAHHNDIAQWGLGTDETGPVRVSSESDHPEPKEPNCFNCPPHFRITYTYAKDATKVCDATQVVCMDGGEKNGVKFVGENGDWIYVDRGTIKASDKKLLDEPLPAGADKLTKSDDHMKNFVECLTSREKPICDVAIGHRSATICHLGNISMRMGNRVLQWQPEKESFFGDALANEMLSRPMRGDWKLEI